MRVSGVAGLTSEIQGQRQISSCGFSPRGQAKLRKIACLQRLLLSQQWFALLKSSPQGGNRVSFGDELMSNVAAIACLFDRLENRRVINLLELVQFVAAWITRRVILANHLVISADGTNDVALHDLHMIDIVKQLHPW